MESEQGLTFPQFPILEEHLDFTNEFKNVPAS